MSHAQPATQQPSLFEPLVVVNYEAHETLDERFARWLQANPQVLRVFLRLADEVKQSGRRRVGAKLVIERMRWEYMTRTTGDEFRLNNSFTSRLARKAIEVRPDLREMFEFRELKS